MPRLIKRILVSQPKPANPKSPYFQLMETYGIEIDFKQFFKIEPLPVRDFRDQKIDILDHTAVVLSSRTIADHFFALLKELRLEVPEDFKYFCTSEVIAVYLQKHITVRKRKIFFPEKSSNTSDLTELIKKYNKEYYFVPTIEGHKEELFSAMEDKGIAYTRGIVSKVVNASFTDDEIKSYDMILFFSPNGVNSLFESNPGYEQGDQLIGCLGEGTLKAIEEANLRADMSVPNKEFTSITAALEHVLQGKALKHA